MNVQILDQSKGFMDTQDSYNKISGFGHRKSQFRMKIEIQLREKIHKIKFNDDFPAGEI